MQRKCRGRQEHGRRSACKARPPPPAPPTHAARGEATEARPAVRGGSEHDCGQKQSGRGDRTACNFPHEQTSFWNGSVLQSLPRPATLPARPRPAALNPDPGCGTREHALRRPPPSAARGDEGRGGWVHPCMLTRKPSWHATRPGAWRQPPLVGEGVGVSRPARGLPRAPPDPQDAQVTPSARAQHAARTRSLSPQVLFPRTRHGKAPAAMHPPCVFKPATTNGDNS